MDNTIMALQALYVALGGTASDVENITIIPDMINAIAQQVTTAGITSKELPTVTTTDNDKVLTVVAGKWAAAAPAVSNG